MAGRAPSIVGTLLRRRGAAPPALADGDTVPFVAPSRRGWRTGAAAGWAVVWLGIAAALVVMGRVALYRPALALVLACAVLAGVLAATDPLALGTFTVLGVWIIERVSAGGIDISGSDTVLAVGAVAALPYVPWGNPAVRKVIAAIVAFEAVLFVTVLVHPSVPGLFEWGHRLFLVGGGVVVGAALGHHGRSRTALRAFLAVAAVVAAAAVVASAANGFAPAQVLGYHKNFIGSMMAAALTLSYLAPRSTGFSAHELVPLKAACVAGLLASQSRGAIVALLVGLVVASARSSAFRRQAVPLFLVLAPLAIFAFLSLQTQVEQPRETATSSITERERYRDQGLEAWRASPATGQGMRFFESSEASLDSDPHNVIVASLSETGVVGLLALLGLLLVTVAVTWRVPTGLGVAAVALIVARFAHGLFDIYWVAGTQLLPWLVVGMALGEPAGERSRPGVPVAGDGLVAGDSRR